MNVAPPTTAIALGRSAGVNITGSTASASGKITAAASPRTARAAMSSPVEVEYAQASEAKPKTASAQISSYFRPIRSPSRPAGSSAAASTRL